MPANEEQIAFWNGPRGLQWATGQEAMDVHLGAFGEAALQAARAQPGERVIDVGCGCGTTTLELARKVGPAGSVLGIDVSAPMIAVARERALALPQVRFELADAASFAFKEKAQVIYSRFGVMFFDDPLAAFTHLASALAPGGRVAFVCWRSLEENPWMTVPQKALAGLVPDPPPPVPGAPGPSSFADPARVRSILEGAGLTDVRLDPFDAKVAFGDGRGAAAAAAEALQHGPAARLLLGADAATRDRAQAALESAFVQLVDGGSVRLSGGVWSVTAHR